MTLDKKYTYEQVRSASLEYFKGDELAAEVFAGKYALQDLEGNFYELTPDDMHRRLTKEFVRIEQKYPNPIPEEEIFRLFSEWKIVPQGSPMSGIGNQFQMQSLSNCFVIGAPEDSYGGIMLTDEEGAQIMKRRGGVGHDISTIRPKGLSTANAARTTDGIGVFMERFSNTTREVAQGGRRGARMITIDVRHPEIETFIDIKKDRTKVTGANISIRVNDAFMTAVEQNKTYRLQWPVDADKPTITKDVQARDVWNKMMLAAWDSAEPGILFWDQVVRESPADCYADVGCKTLSTNPCGEVPLSLFSSCRLILINAFAYVNDPFSDKSTFDFNSFKQDSITAQRLMDDLVDLEIEATDRILEKIRNDKESFSSKQRELDLWKMIRKSAQDDRRTGLGITGLGDVIAGLGLKYGSNESISTTSMIYQLLSLGSYESSLTMGDERGPFPLFNPEKEKSNPFIKRVLKDNKRFRDGTYKRRNIANLTTSPAGTVSILTQTTSGCEPAIFLRYTRRKKINPNDKLARVDFVDQSGDKWQEYDVFHHGHLQWAKVNGKDPVKDLEESPYFGCTASEIDPLKKVELQAAAQMWVDHAISNTTNLHKDTPVEKVSELYLEAWKRGCKGLTVYRDGSRSGVMVASGSEKDKTKDKSTIQEASAPERPQTLPCDIFHTKIKGVSHILIVGLLDGKPYEIFFGESQDLGISKTTSGEVVMNESKSGTRYDLVVGEDRYENIVDVFDNPNYGAFTRTLSTTLRFGVPIKHIVEQLRKDKHADMFSFSSVVSRVLAKKYIQDGEKSEGKRCIDCDGKNVVYIQGCQTCMDCGSSKCG